MIELDDTISDASPPETPTAISKPDMAAIGVPAIRWAGSRSAPYKVPSRRLMTDDANVKPQKQHIAAIVATIAIDLPIEASS